MCSYVFNTYRVCNVCLVCITGDEVDQMGGYSYLHTDDFVMHDDSLAAEKVR